MGKGIVRASLLRTALAVLTSAGASCTAAQQHPQAEAAYANGDFLEAADFYASDARLEPLDGASAAKLKGARESFAMSLLQRASAARRRGAFDRAISALKEVLAKRDTWKWQPPAAVSTKIAEEVLELGRGVRAQVDVPLKAGDALDAERLYREYAKYLKASDFVAQRESIESAIRDVGRRRCSEHAQAITKEMPYATFLTARYCAHFDAEAPALVERPELLSRLTATGTVQGLSTPGAVKIRRALEEAFESSPFFAKDSPRAATAKLAGTVAVTFSATVRNRQANWTETQTIGPTTVSGSVGGHPFTGVATTSITSDDPASSHSILGSTITKDRVYSYVATEHVGKYASTMLVQIDLGPPSGVVEARADQDRAETGYYHDVVFEPAHIEPERPNLHSAEEFIAGQTKLAQFRMVQALKAKWNTLFCDRESFSLEEAARCLYGTSDKLSEGVERSLRGEFRGEVGELSRLLPQPATTTP